MSHQICVSCGGTTIGPVTRSQSFPYGASKTLLEVKVEVFECKVCDLMFTNSEAETIRDEAVRKHLCK